MTQPLYDCEQCPAYCCTVYEGVSVTEEDGKRLARRLNLTVAMTAQLYFALDTLRPNYVNLRRKPDPVTGGKCCTFLDTTTRRCSVYEDRPGVCRVWPDPTHAAPGAEGRCCYYDALVQLRNECHPNAMPLVQIGRWRR